MARTEVLDDIEDTFDVDTEEDTAEEDTPQSEVKEKETVMSDEEKKLEQEIEAGLEKFEALVQAAVDGASEDGQIGDELLEPAVEAYREIPGGAKGKNRAKKFVTEGMKSALSSGASPDAYVKAVAWNEVQDGISAPAAKAAAPKPPADPTDAFVEKVASLRLALELVEGNPPEGVSEDWEERVEFDFESAESAYQVKVGLSEGDLEELEGDLGSVEKAAIKIAGRKRSGGGGGGGSVYTGPRRDVAKHIKEAFAGLESGQFLTIAEIRAHQSEEYGSDAPSAGAVSARLFPKTGNCTVEGVVPDQNEKGTRGAKKA